MNRVRRAALGRVREDGLRVQRGFAYGADPSQRLDVWWPGGDGPAPAIVLLHGGGWIEGTRRDFVSLAPAFARAGLLAVAVDYRLAPRAAWPEALDDVCAAIERLPSLGGDPTRVVLWGHSAGGHLALMAARRAPQAVCAVVGLGAPADVRLLVGVEADLARRVFGERDLAEVSPVCHPGSTPTLVVHGTADRVCDIAGARALAVAEPEHVRIIEVRGGDHGLRWPPLPCFRARREAFDWAVGRGLAPPRIASSV